MTEATPGREQNALARDSYSYLHALAAVATALWAMVVLETVGYGADRHRVRHPGAAHGA